MEFIGSENARMEFECHLNIAYGDTARQKLDIYGENLSSNSPLLIFVHGGYWQMCEKSSSSFFVGPLIESGVRVIIIGYDLCPTVSLAQLVKQIQRSFEWVSDYVERNSIKTVAFAGHSAGAHLLACALTQEFIHSIAADTKLLAYFISGVFDLEELYLLKAANENNILSLDENSARELSPQFHDFKHLNERNLKIYVWVGEDESPKFIEQSKNFAVITLRNNDSVSFETVNGLDHFDIVEKLSNSDFHLTRQIIANIKEPKN